MRTFLPFLVAKKHCVFIWMFFGFESVMVVSQVLSTVIKWVGSNLAHIKNIRLRIPANCTIPF